MAATVKKIRASGVAMELAELGALVWLPGPDLVGEELPEAMNH